MVSLAFYGCSTLLWKFPYMRKKYAKILAAKFSPLFHLHCYRQLASILTFISDYFVKLLLLKCLRSIKTRKLHVRSVVPKLQSLKLRVTRRVVQLEHCIVPYVPISPQNSKRSNYHIAKKHSAPKPDITFKC